MEKKYLIPTIIGVILLCGIVFTVVYKKNDTKQEKPTVETLAPKETTQAETKVSGKETDSTQESIEKSIIVYAGDDGKLLSEQEVKVIEESEQEEIAKMVEEASIASESIKAQEQGIDPTEASETEEESLSPEEFSDFQSKVSSKVRELTDKQATENMRKALKFDVEKYASEHPELQGITPEMIDNYSEEEVYDLYNKISVISRGY